MAQKVLLTHGGCGSTRRAAHTFNNQQNRRHHRKTDTVGSGFGRLLTVFSNPNRTSNTGSDAGWCRRTNDGAIINVRYVVILPELMLMGLNSRWEAVNDLIACYIVIN